MLQRPHTVFGPRSSQTEENVNLLIETGLLLSSTHSLNVIVEKALSTGLSLSGGRFGAYFCNTSTSDACDTASSPNQPEPLSLYQAIGLDAAAFAALPVPRPSEILNRASVGPEVLRFDDITEDQDAFRFAHNVPHAVVAAPAPGNPDLPVRTLPIRSYIAVPVRSRSGAALGIFVFGHPEPNMFSSATGDLLSALASHTASAAENATLAESLQNEMQLLDASRTLQRQTALRLRLALDAAQLGTWTWDRSTDLLDLDERAASLLHCKAHTPITRAELRERTLACEDILLNVEKIGQSAQTDGIYSTECRVGGSGTLATWVSVSGIATFAPDSTIIDGMVGTVQNITTRKTQEAALRESEKLAATGRLAATIAHEINNPLEAVTNLIYLCRTDPAVPTACQQLLETADAELARVAQIAQQTLGFYRDTTLPGQIDLNCLLQNVVDLFARKMNSHRITYHLDLEPGLCIQGLQGEIRQVFSNLIVNAIDAFSSVSRPGCLHIRGRRFHGHPNGVSILVSDDGAGIPLHVRDRIFSAFFTTKQSVGTGLGLWVTRSFVEKQGGTIRFRTSTCAPSGTIFRVFLPSSMPVVRYTTQ